MVLLSFKFIEHKYYKLDMYFERKGHKNQRNSE